MDNLPESEFPSSGREQTPPTQQLKSKLEGAKNEASKLKDGVSEQAAASFDSAKANVKEVAQQAAGYGQGVINEQKGKLAETVQEYCRAAQAASEKLVQEGHTALASRADEIAARLDRASAYLRERKLLDIYYDAEHLTRNRPEIVFGIMFAAGLVAGRFLKASNRGATNGRASEIQVKETVPSPASPASAIAPEPGKII